MNQEKLTTLLELMRDLNMHTKEEGGDTTFLRDHKPEYYNLLMEMGSFVSRVCGNANKLGEKTVELKLLMKYEEEGDETVTIKHVKNTYGPDLVITSTEHKKRTNIEVKTSVVAESKGYKANWNFEVNLRKFDVDNTDDIINRLFRHIHKSQYNGLIIVTAVNDANVFYECTISGLFMSLLLAKMTVKGKSYSRNGKKINLGSLYCICHQTYHRFNKYSEYDAKLQERMKNMKIDDEAPNEDIFNDKEWKDLLSPTTNSCKK
jgi:hypothetical protein